MSFGPIRSWRRPPGEGAPITWALRDRPYVVMTVLMAAMAVHYSILDVAVPLWLVSSTSAPHVLVSVLFVVNTIVVVLLQVAVSRRVESVARAARTVSWAGLAFLAACVAFAAAAGRSPHWASGLLLLAGLLHVVGELMQAAAQFCLSQELALDRAQGQYQGLASTGMSLSTMLAPAVIIALPITLGTAGWLILGSLLLVLGVAVRFTTGWVAATRPRYAVG